jgi:hypothetical protein
MLFQYKVWMMVFRFSAAIALALALLLAALPQVFAGQRCDMLRPSASQARDCHGCCKQMKCCPVSEEKEKAQFPQPSKSRADSGIGSVFAVVSKELPYSFPGNLQSYLPFEASFSRPAALSLARLCIRLI